jgi:hypothetical protein
MHKLITKQRENCSEDYGLKRGHLQLNCFFKSTERYHARFSAILPVVSSDGESVEKSVHGGDCCVAGREDSLLLMRMG